MKNDDVTKNMTDLEKVNYYNDKINKNILLCRIRLLIYIILIPTFFSLASKNSETKIYLIIFYILIGSYLIWWLITFTKRNKNIKKMLLASKNESFVLCDKCKKYKYSDRKCDTCGDNKILSEEEKKELLDKYRITKDTISMIRKVITVLIIIAEIIAIIFFVIAPSKIDTNFSIVYLVNLLFYVGLIIISIMVTCGVLLFVVNNSSYIIERYIIKIELLDDNSK